jgi:hypothetical protein
VPPITPLGSVGNATDICISVLFAPHPTIAPSARSPLGKPVGTGRGSGGGGSGLVRRRRFGGLDRTSPLPLRRRQRLGRRRRLKRDEQRIGIEQRGRPRTAGAGLGRDRADGPGFWPVAGERDGDREFARQSYAQRPITLDSPSIYAENRAGAAIPRAYGGLVSATLRLPAYDDRRDTK